ncbi:MAG: sulfurtransferase-like selenium metabolism protein YedF [Tissierellia bacterium]|nr:sulfurtransferase-like selenium metabolism protein YedF [Tissierellia bacterium]
MKNVIILRDDAMGGGSQELGRKLMGTFLLKLWGSSKKPEGIIFYNGGVKLLTAAGGSLEALEALEKQGVDLVACGTCIDFFGIGDQIEVGRVSGMEEILDIIQTAEKVVTI